MQVAGITVRVFNWETVFHKCYRKRDDRDYKGKKMKEIIEEKFPETHPYKYKGLSHAKENE